MLSRTKRTFQSFRDMNRTAAYATIIGTIVGILSLFVAILQFNNDASADKQGEDVKTEIIISDSVNTKENYPHIYLFKEYCTFLIKYDAKAVWNVLSDRGRKEGHQNSFDVFAKEVENYKYNKQYESIDYIRLKEIIDYDEQHKVFVYTWKATNQDTEVNDSKLLAVKSGDGWKIDYSIVANIEETEQPLIGQTGVLSLKIGYVNYYDHTYDYFWTFRNLSDTSITFSNPQTKTSSFTINLSDGESKKITIRQPYMTKSNDEYSDRMVPEKGQVISHIKSVLVEDVSYMGMGEFKTFTDFFEID